MRIGLMLRAVEEKGGVGVYARNITAELLAFDRANEYVLYYRNPARLGSFDKYENVTERVIKGSNNAVWDQLLIPLACRRDRLDVLFHPKFTVPLFAPCETAMVLHGAGWFIPEFESFWSPLDLRYIKTVMPLYCKRASAVLSVSELTTQIFNERFKLPSGKVRTVYFAPGRQFRRVTDEGILAKVKAKYGLPDRFIFTLSKYPGGDRKNIDGVLKAYELFHGKTIHKLVVGGKDCDRFRADYNISDEGYGKDILFPGYISQEDLPAVYSMADLYLYPSNMEAFPVPITEALACGVPIVTSDQNGLKEIAGDAALRVDARNPEEIAGAITQVLTDAGLCEALSQKALEHSKRYSWDKCVRETLQILEGLKL